MRNPQSSVATQPGEYFLFEPLTSDYLSPSISKGQVKHPVMSDNHSKTDNNPRTQTQTQKHTKQKARAKEDKTKPKAHKPKPERVGAKLVAA